MPVGAETGVVGVNILGTLGRRPPRLPAPLLLPRGVIPLKIYWCFNSSTVPQSFVKSILRNFEITIVH